MGRQGVVPPDWLTWPQAAEIVGCPVPTIDWHQRSGRIESRPHHGPRPTLKRESVEEFAKWWMGEQQRRAERRAERLVPRPPAKSPPDRDGWLTTDQAAEILGRTRAHVVRLWHAGALPGERRVGRIWVEETAVVAYSQRIAEWVSMADAATLADCSPSTINRAVRRGELAQREVRNALPSLSRVEVSRWGESRSRAAAARSVAVAPKAPSPPDDEHEWIRAAEVAEMLGITQSRVRQLARAERLPCVQIGSRWWFRVDLMQTLGRPMASPPGARARP